MSAPALRPDGSLGDATAARTLLLDAIRAMRSTYRVVPFFVERDVVWTVQRWLLDEVARLGLPFDVRTEHAMEPGPRRALAADLAVLNRGGAVIAAVEFKYEPSHRRGDIPKTKFPVVEWAAVVSDFDRVRRWSAEGRCVVGLALFIDEGGHFRHREAPPCSAWHDWSESGVAVLATDFD